MNQFFGTLKRYRMVARGDRVVVAVSGGPDSVALFNLFLEARASLDLRLAVAHLNHGIRGREADRDETFVRAMAADHELPFYSERLVPGSLEGGGSLEERARNERYRFLRSVRDRFGAARIAVGHHRDDQAETFLMRLLRGSGRLGLGSIPPVRGEYLIRPLIEMTREEILEYLRLGRHPYREDSSNQDRRFLRNRIRKDLLPLLASQYNPSISAVLSGTADRLREEECFLDTETRKAFLKVMGEKDRPGLSVSEWKKAPAGLRKRILVAALEHWLGSRRPINSRHIDAIQALMEERSEGHSVTLPGRNRARRNGDWIEFHRPGTPAQRPSTFRLLLPVPGYCRLPDPGPVLRCRLLPRDQFRGDLRSGGRDRVFLDADRLHPPLVIRTREAGDRFLPFGAPGGKKLKDFFIDRKVPAGMRDVWPLVTSDEEIVWVVGYRIGDRYRVDRSTRNILILEQEARNGIFFGPGRSQPGSISH
ncbi:MAG: tRNA lysidine(34) synthetase TilS [Acidobacteria bacterium]|nr:tRNA lysidine(34) synthetase TilS [Acidobacteriota bacterium]